jgi:hypothetical protein
MGIPHSQEDLKSRSEQIPADFPRPGIASSVAGSQPKLAFVESNGEYYVSGCTPLEMLGRWEICEDLVQQFVAKAKSDKAGKRSHLTETEILANYLGRLPDTGWCSFEEARWIIHRTAAILGWLPPKGA